MATRFSQNLEEDYILEYFKDQSEGTFIDIGANDGATLSNTRALALKGFRGCLVEPAPIAYAKLKQLYSKEKKGCFYTYNCAIGDHNGKGTLFDSGTLLKSGDTSLVSTLIAEEKKRFESVLSYTPVEVDVYKWKTFLNRLTIKKFDFVSIDAESLDITILYQMDLSDVMLLCIEWNSIEQNKRLILDYASKFGMDNVIYTSAENLLICRK